MSKITLDPAKLLGFRLETTAGDGLKMGGKLGEKPITLGVKVGGKDGLKPAD